MHELFDLVSFYFLSAMPITLAQADYSALFDEMESGQSPGSDLDDVTWNYPTALGQGFYRSIQLRDGLELAIVHYQLRDDLILQLPARPHVNELGIEIRIAHYPPYTSKYNPIEHHLFPHVSRVCQGVIFESVQTVQDLIATATTRTGVTVFATILEKTYQTGGKVAEGFKANMKIVFDEFLPQWNYTAKPELQVI
ncbi:ISAzo13-like element transposase-related protein [Leptolyngbya sp. 7M]|uniref:ISAzo13-like element transposase-related protein n=1 Tax=Leptolyngbya sp. 7M TaxID=2812896 RepID=UPI001B8BAFA3|nr:hypothetical protein [Leptolyngbya sp. 7M]QYO63736.1 hypothetical protein JVX88_28395 [Leptolyngbya sp. 7M]